MVVTKCVGGSGVSNAKVVMVDDEEATVPKYPKHLRRLKSPLGNHKCYMELKWVRLQKAMVVWRMIWWMANAKM